MSLPLVMGESSASEVLEQSIGDADAPVTIIEYSSLSCPHCAAFHKEVLPELKERYVDTGKVRMVFRDFPTNGPALDAAVLAHCAGPDRYIGFLDVLFQTQASWASSPDPRQALKQLGKLGGLDEPQMDACFDNESMVDGILKLQIDGQNEHNVRSTPTFVINDDVHVGNRSIDEFAELIDAEL
jgi:protein-disulfide isomerase